MKTKLEVCSLSTLNTLQMIFSGFSGQIAEAHQDKINYKYANTWNPICNYEKIYAFIDRRVIRNAIQIKFW